MKSLRRASSSARAASRRTSVAGALEFLRKAMRRRTVAFVLSDFQEPDAASTPSTLSPSTGSGQAESKGFELPLRLAARKHDLVPVRLSDRLERELPPAGLAWIEDPETGAVIRVDFTNRSVRDRLRAAVLAEDEALTRLFARLRLDHAHVRADDADSVTPLLAFFRARARRRG